jgi:hypothetical protein
LAFCRLYLGIFRVLLALLLLVGLPSLSGSAAVPVSDMAVVADLDDNPGGPDGLAPWSELDGDADDEGLSPAAAAFVGRLPVRFLTEAGSLAAGGECAAYGATGPPAP